MTATPLTPGDATGLLEGSLALLRAEVAALPPSLMDWHPAPGEWCVKEVIGHLIEAEGRGFSGRIRIILGAADPPLQSWDQNAVARERRDCARDVRDLLHTLVVLREEGVALARRLRPDQLTRGGHHPTVGYVRVADLLHEWVHHDRNHLKQILANVQSFVWPH
ncbi:MAG: DinB family protein, partial [Candidatus Rokuibacteriota bacterium]